MPEDRSMTDRPFGSPLAALLDRMISSGEAACERYKRVADDQGQRLLCRLVSSRVVEILTL